MAVLALDVGLPETADACGVPPSVAVKRTPRRAIARTSNPSRVLLVSTKAAVLKRDLSAAGHHVDAAPSSSTAAGDYAVVVVDSNDEASKARARFKQSIVFVRSGDNREDVKTVEARVAHRPDSRTKIDARTVRPPVATGPIQVPKEQRVVIDRKQDDTVLVTETIAKPAAIPALSEEIIFSRGSARVAGSGSIEKAVRWLSSNPTVRVTIEGHADPTGTPEGNLALGRTRAEGVRDELVSAGIASSRIDVVTYGDTRLKYGATDGRNRRVVIEAKK